MEMMFEDKDDFEDFEAMLYSQVHHEAAESTENIGYIASPNPNYVRFVTNTSVVNKAMKRNSGRYWNRESGPFIKQCGNIANKTPISNSGNKVSTTKNNTRFDKVFASDQRQSEVNKNTNIGVISNASKGNPNIKGSIKQSARNQNKKKGNKNVQENNNGPFTARDLKLKKTLKMMEKKRKAQKSRKAAKDYIEEIVVIDSSDNDDVFEIPMPPPPLVTIESSDEEKIPEEPQSNKGKLLKHHSTGSPSSSIVSDDFIGQKDRSRLVNENQVADEESLQFARQTVDNMVNKKHIQPIPSCSKNNNYTVNRSDFRAVDIYESESSDMPENIKPKAEHLNLDATPKKNKNQPKLKIRKTRKRRTSINNKNSDFNDDSTESENEAIEGPIRPFVSSTPHIIQGEAVENFRGKVILKPSKSKSIDINCSDNEFISMLSTIVRGDSSGTGDESESEVSEKSVTARVIAEDVLNRGAGDLCEDSNNDNCNNETVISNVIPAEEKENSNEPDTNRNNNNDHNNISDERSYIVEVSSNESGDERIPDAVFDEVNRIFENIERPVHNKGKELINSSAKENNNFLKVVHTNDSNIGWNEEMMRFYNDSWKGESFDLKKIYAGMASSKKWAICSRDRFVTPKKYIKKKCFNCLEIGHTAKICPKPKQELICYMCGEAGHREPRCPNTICLQCGRKTNTFVKSCGACSFQKFVPCSICKMRGHIPEFCPDTWRRYHSTTLPNIVPKDNITYNKTKKFCSICARRGHLAENCRYGLKFLDYPLCTSQIQSNSKTYEDSLAEIPDTIGYNLCYDPNDPIEFQFANDITPKQYYGRFLSAVGLDGLINRRIENDDSRKRRIEDDDFRKKRIEDDDSRKRRKEEKKDQSNQESKKNCLVLNPFAKKIKKNMPRLKKPDQMPITGRDGCGEPSVTLGELTNVEKHIVKSTKEIHKTSQNIKNMQSTSENVCRNTMSFKDRNIRERKNREENTVPLSNVNENARQHCSSFSEDMRESYKEINNIPNVEVPFSTRQQTPGFVADLNETETFGSATSKGYCVAKIYLPNFHIKHLLSPQGNKFLIENSKRFSVKISFENSSVGKMLMLEGESMNQDKFQNELLEYFRNLVRDANQNHVKQMRKVPRKRESLIKFLQSDVALLQKNLGDVQELFDRLMLAEKQLTDKSWRSADKIRRILNIILLGQTGLAEGKAHLNALYRYLNILQNELSDEIVSANVRNNVQNHWSYIFSSQPQNDYSKLIKEYIVLKKQQSPRKQFVSQTSRMLGSPKGNRSNNFPLNRQNSHNYAKIKKNDDNSASNYWSNECLKFVEDCLEIDNVPRQITDKLFRVRDKAERGMLSYNDYQILLKIYDQITKRHMN